MDKMLEYYKTRTQAIVGLIEALELEIGIEVGVREGFFSREILNLTSIPKLYGLDISVLSSARRLEREFPGRYELLTGRSPAFASTFGDCFFDLIHIDANHSQAAVKADVAAWWPKLKPGGIFSGDDFAYVDNPTEGVYGVVDVVCDFVKENNLTLYVSGVNSTDLTEQLEFARFNGDQADLYLRNKSHKPFVNPCWYLQKPE